MIEYWIFYNYDSLTAGLINQWHQSDWEQCGGRADVVVYVLRLVTRGRKTRGHGPPQRITGSST